MDVYDRIDQLLKEKGVSRRKAAQMAGIPPTTLSGALYRKSGLSAAAVAALAQTLGVDTDYLLNGNEPKKGYSGTLNLEGLTDEEIKEQGEKFVASTKRFYKTMDDTTKTLRRYHEVFEKYGITMEDYFQMMLKYDAMIGVLAEEYHLTSEQFTNLLNDILTVTDATATD